MDYDAWMDECRQRFAEAHRPRVGRDVLRPSHIKRRREECREWKQRHRKATLDDWMHYCLYERTV